MNIDEYYHMKDASRRRVMQNNITTKRFLFDKIDWRDRLIMIAGSRGRGKTTLVLQHIKSAFEDKMEDVLYASLDDLWFETHSLLELADIHYKNGGTHLFLDEVHYLDNWQLIIKNLYDNYPNMHITFTGSSILRIEANSGDLSRRMVRYNLPGLSFREYLIFENVVDVQAKTIDELVLNHKAIAESIVDGRYILKHFNKYTAQGYYPFYNEVHYGYYDRLNQVTNQILESDYQAVENVNYSTVKKIKKMLYILAQSCPQTPKMSYLYNQLETDRNQGLKMLYALDGANLLNTLSSDKSLLKNMSRPDKIYCDNTNLMYSLTENINIGTKRETFFLNQLRSAGYEVTYPEKGDFMVSGKFLFEVGGKNKNYNQIANMPNSYLAIDDIETGWGNKIPLWMFGLLY